MNLEDGKSLVKLARSCLFFNKFNIPNIIEKRGVFVTIHTVDGNLRGCIGFIETKLPLNKAVIEAARYAAFSDPRFRPVHEKELDEILFEISILTKPKLIKVKSYEEYLKKIKIGRDGLIAQADKYKGLLLPQVASENKFSIQEFLNQTCLKAGLLPETWQQKSCKIYSFQTQIFKEKEPNGEIIEKKCK
jgi:hypothetical protein